MICIFEPQKFYFASLYIPFVVLYISFPSVTMVKNSVGPSIDKFQLIKKWVTFTNFFRRMNKIALLKFKMRCSQQLQRKLVLQKKMIEQRNLKFCRGPNSTKRRFLLKLIKAKCPFKVPFALDLLSCASVLYIMKHDITSI